MTSESLGNGAIFTCPGISFALIWKKISAETEMVVMFHMNNQFS